MLFVQPLCMSEFWVNSEAGESSDNEQYTR